jgi:hypothetical protein
MWMRSALIVLLALALSGCIGSGDKEKTPSGSFAKARGCSTLTVDDIKRLTGKKTKKRDLAPSPEIRCSSVFFLGATELAVSISERDGDARTLKRLRTEKTHEVGATTTQPVSGLGEDAFVAGKRILGFRHGDTVVILETGYTGGTQLTLKVADLKRIGELVAERL